MVQAMNVMSQREILSVSPDTHRNLGIQLGVRPLGSEIPTEKIAAAFSAAAETYTFEPGKHKQDLFFSHTHNNKNRTKQTRATDTHNTINQQPSPTNNATIHKVHHLQNRYHHHSSLLLLPSLHIISITR